MSLFILCRGKKDKKGVEEGENIERGFIQSRRDAPLL